MLAGVFQVGLGIITKVEHRRENQQAQVQHHDEHHYEVRAKKTVSEMKSVIGEEEEVPQAPPHDEHHLLVQSISTTL